jgi:phage shock protein C
MHRQGLFRSRTDKVIGGVAGGIARSLNADPAVVRLIFALLVIFGGGGLLLYLILWIALPEEPIPFFPEPQATAEGDQQEPSAVTPPVVPTTRNNGALIGGLIMIGIGLVFLADRLIPRIHFGDFWPVVIVIAGVALIISSFNGFNRKSA